MEKIRRGRPKSKNPRNKQISFPVTEEELKEAKDFAVKHDLTYIEIFFNGLKNWPDK